MNRTALASAAAAAFVASNGADTNLPKLLAWTRNVEQDPLFPMGDPA